MKTDRLEGEREREERRDEWMEERMVELEDGRKDGSDGGVRAMAIILHRFTPVRDGWTCNEVWDLEVAACACLRLIAFWMYCGADVSPVCMCVWNMQMVRCNLQ